MRNTEKLTLLSSRFRTNLFFLLVFVTHRSHQEASGGHVRCSESRWKRERTSGLQRHLRSQVKAGAQVRLHVDNEHMHLFDTATGEAIFYKRGGCCCLFCCHALRRAAVGTSEQFCVCDPMLVTEYNVVH